MKNIKQTVKSVFFAWIVLVAIQLQAQEKHFIYIQSENKQPFYVQLNNQTFSSTPGGYLIIPQLMSGKYNLVTGFAKNQYPEQKFMVDLTNRDAGFSLKLYGDKGWGLFDLVNLNSIMADNKEAGEVKRTEVSNGAEVIEKDTTTSAAPAKNAITAVDPVAGSSDNGNTVTSRATKDSSTTVNVQVNEADNAVGKAAASSVVVKTFEKPGNSGFDQIYVDKSNGKPDTIALFIPKGETAGTDNITPKKQQSANIAVSRNAARCTVQASDRDFYKTRLDLAAATTEEAMMLAARTAFESKCYSTKQVKYLGMLFLSEQSRYNFLALAKPFVFDIENFPSLQSQFTEPDIIQKFRVLLKKK